MARLYSGTLGKTGNCQIGVSVHLVNEPASCAADWRLYCPASSDGKALEISLPAAQLQVVNSLAHTASPSQG